VFEAQVIRRNLSEQLTTGGVGQDSHRIHSDRSILHSWKQISVYLGLGIRTVQRYEVQLQLPVHRPAAKTVMAFSDEIDSWLRSAPTRNELLPAPQPGTAQPALVAQHKQQTVTADEKSKVNKFKVSSRDK
jgi:hypothetical protein